jgi:hypothetical protein
MNRMNAVSNLDQATENQAPEHLRKRTTRHTMAAVLLATALLPCTAIPAGAETCTTQSALAPGERDRLADTARTLALKVQANDAAGLKASASADLVKDFGALQYLVAVTAPKLAGAAPVVEQLYLLDATTLKRNADNTPSEGQFFCSLNKSTLEAEFDIPALPPGRYAFVMVTMASATAPWRLSFLLRQDPPGQGNWLIAGFYPKATTAAGHDGLWYWTQARQFVKDKQLWNAWLYYQEASRLLQPADFVTSTHLEKLRSEASDAAPPALSDGVSIDAPLVVKAAGGAEYHFTGLSVEDAPAPASLDITARLHVDPIADQAAARTRNAGAAAALLAAYPELRKPFHGVAVYAEATGQPPFATEVPMSEIK